MLAGVGMDVGDQNRLSIAKYGSSDEVRHEFNGGVFGNWDLSLLVAGGVLRRHTESLTRSDIVDRKLWCNLVNFRREASKSVEQHKESCAGPTKPEEFAFTHTDLAPRNIILEEETNNLSLVDWDQAGFYPRYFEFAGMRNFMVPPEWGWWGELRWKLDCWIAAGWYEKERIMLNEVQRKAGWFPAARRFSIKAGVTPSWKAVDD
ncbi:hypothetical protein QBC35DRAFT_497350 [Podospora australis]|uniref:Aminoglycoside phosphotransferase domain-containing protein n=1 Tax=Podospora australis TaxID=1536484 RepID=A0AAN6WVI8_9PEZI|nr:hypothetical protein QBC35DRAFT_497350 [Podospora australis]